MKINGFMLRRAIKLWEGRRDAAIAVFPASLSRYADESVVDPVDISRRALAAEKNIVLLQSAQADFNLRVIVPYRATQISLCAAVKMVGAIGRIEKIWRDAAAPAAQTRYGEESRDLDKKYKVSTITPEAALTHAEVQSGEKSLLVEAIAIGNGTKIEFETLGASLFE